MSYGDYSRLQLGLDLLNLCKTIINHEGNRDHLIFECIETSEERDLLYETLQTNGIIVTGVNNIDELITRIETHHPEKKQNKTAVVAHALERYISRVWQSKAVM